MTTSAIGVQSVTGAIDPERRRLFDQTLADVQAAHPYPDEDDREPPGL